MVAENFQIYGVQITGSTFASQKICSILIMSPKQNIPPGRRKLPISSEQRSLKIYFFPAEKGRGEDYEAKKIIKIKVARYWSLVLINSIIFATSTFLVSVLL